jgi:phage/plasmid primase-like uncharacterized protein
LYSAGVPDSAIGDPHSSQNFAPGRDSAPQVKHANAGLMPAPPILGDNHPDRAQQ